MPKTAPPGGIRKERVAGRHLAAGVMAEIVLRPGAVTVSCIAPWSTTPVPNGALLPGAGFGNPLARTRPGVSVLIDKKTCRWHARVMPSNQTLFSATFLMPATPATVWQHLREPELLRRWFGWHGPEFEDEIAGLSGGFSTVEHEGRAVVIGDHRMGLQEVSSGTELRISRITASVEHGVEIDEGWVTFLEQLRYVITVQPAGARHTLVIPGVPAPDIPWEHDEWARSARQRTVLAPAWGHVQVAIIEPTAGGPAARVVVNGYGRTDDQVVEQHAAVTAWVAASSSS